MTTPTKQSNTTISQALEDFDKKFVRVKSGKWKLIGWDAEASEADFKSFLQSKLEEAI